jgi:signal transduction histidine kinase
MEALSSMRILETEKGFKIPFEPGFMPAPEWGADFWTGLVDGLPNPLILFKEDGCLLFANSEAQGFFLLDGLEGPLPEWLRPLLGLSPRLELYDHGRGISLAPPGSGEPRHIVLKSISLRGSGRILAAMGAVAPASRREAGDGPEALGEGMAMAGEMSQRVKGPLAGIELYASIIGEELDGAGESGLSRLVDGIRAGVREANEYLTSVESMTEPLKLDLSPMNLGEAVDEALEALEQLFKSRGIGVLVEHKDMTVEADRALAIQMFLNILINAAEAMPMGGRLTVREEMNRSGEAEVIFSDTGPGVPAPDARRIFNPFFTTKSQPLGLGLPVSRRIAEAHQGRIAVGMEDPGGARVKVVLPCIPEASKAPFSLN